VDYVDILGGLSIFFINKSDNFTWILFHLRCSIIAVDWSRGISPSRSLLLWWERQKSSALLKSAIMLPTYVDLIVWYERNRTFSLTFFHRYCSLSWLVSTTSTGTTEPKSCPFRQETALKGQFQHPRHSKGRCYLFCYTLRTLQYWPKVTHAKKRSTRAGCNACDARFRRVLHRICNSKVAHMKRASCVHHLRGMCAGCCSGSMWHTRWMRTSDAFVARVSSIHVLQMSRTSSA
jgi:hypothetical protein